MKQVVMVPEGIEYVTVEIIDKTASSEDCEIFTGLFKGLATLENDKDEQLFILVAGPKDVVDIYNFKYYNIMTLVVSGKETKNMTYFTLAQKDQEAALGALKDVIVKMYAENRMLEHDPDIIDISTFKNIPDDFEKTHKAFRRSQNNFNTSQQTADVSYIRKDPEPSIIKRTKTKKPTKKILLNTITKIINIKKGVFTAVLPKISEDEDEDDQHYYV